MTEQQKFIEWHAKEVANHGLVDMKFFASHIPEGMEAEEFYREANLVNRLHAEGNVIDRPDVI